MTRLFLLLSGAILTAFVSVGCAGQPAPAGAASNGTSGPIVAPSNYFSAAPISTWYPGADRFMREWYLKPLIAMHEPPLPERAGTGFRFLYLRSFDPPIAVRVEHGSQGYTLRAVVLEPDVVVHVGSHAEAKPGAISQDLVRDLRQSEWADVTESITKLGFWKLPQEDTANDGLDGAQWILEGFEEGRYHIVHRWSPESGTFREGCLVFLKIAGIDVPSDRLY